MAAFGLQLGQTRKVIGEFFRQVVGNMAHGKASAAVAKPPYDNPGRPPLTHINTTGANLLLGKNTSGGRPKAVWGAAPPSATPKAAQAKGMPTSVGAVRKAGDVPGEGVDL
ncbi:hypothetical protein JANAI61_01790 [Jannaschia sp. AI_61]|nr:hypothetical protein JANAI61_01790 [Jannaschia sp. AI_61]